MLRSCSGYDALTWGTLSRYAQEVDVDFVRRSIKAIGQTAIKIDEAAERCVNVLLELIGTRVSYVVQEAVVVMKVRCAAISRWLYVPRNECIYL